MRPKTIKRIHLITITLFCIAMLMDGIAGLARAEEGKIALQHLGYPVYAMSIFGLAKVLGVMALVQPKYKTLKEWAFAGFAINFIGAAASRMFVGDHLILILPPIIMLLFMLVTYFFWRKYQNSKLPEAAYFNKVKL